MPQELRAPARGHYKRGQSREERQAEQHERLLEATCQALAVGSPTVADIVTRAGVGRNTFYEYFDDLAHGLAAVQQRATALLTEHFASEAVSVRTPVERVRALTRGWLNALDAEPILMRAALQPAALAQQPVRLSHAALRLLSELQLLAGRKDVVAALPDVTKSDHLLALAAVFDTLTRAHLAKQPRDRAAIERVLTALTLRILR